MVEMYNMKKRLQQNNVTTIYDVITSPIQSLFRSKVIISSTRPGFLFYNISLHGFNSVLQAFRIEFICNSCLDNTTGFKFENVKNRYAILFTHTRCTLFEPLVIVLLHEFFKTVQFRSLKFAVADTNFTVVKMHVPWSKGHLYLNIP